MASLSPSQVCADRASCWFSIAATGDRSACANCASSRSMPVISNKQAGRRFVILSDPGAQVIRQYGLLHQHGKGDIDIALRTTFVIDENGRERWRKVSATIPEIPKAAEVLQQLRGMQ